jgi:hypothetical protein
MLMVMLIKLIVARGYVAQFPSPATFHALYPTVPLPTSLTEVGHCLGLKVKQSQEREWSPRSETNTPILDIGQYKRFLHIF